MPITGNTCTVTAVKWDNGWDLYLDDDNVTSVTHIKDAQQQVRDYLDTVNPNHNHSNMTVNVTS
ncbi:hypothetical protein QVA66_10130 [Staphylococcus chromogenes]|nr:hypothetical protein [Staphylococcus chromogenes]